MNIEEDLAVAVACLCIANTVPSARRRRRQRQVQVFFVCISHNHTKTNWNPARQNLPRGPLWFNFVKNRRKIASTFEHVRNSCDIATTIALKSRWNRSRFTRGILKLQLRRDKTRLFRLEMFLTFYKLPFFTTVHVYHQIDVDPVLEECVYYAHVPCP